MNKNIISLISLVTGLVLIFILINPFWSSIRILKTEISQQEKAISQTEEILAKVEQLDQDYQNLKATAQKIFLALPKEKDIPQLLVQFENLALTNGLVLESIDFIQVAQESQRSSRQEEKTDQSRTLDFPYLSLVVKASGPYDAFKRYLVALENNIRSMDVSSIKITPYQLGGTMGTLAWDILELNLEVEVYYQ